MPNPFEPDSPSARALLTWWKELQDAPGERAELRRATTLPQVVITPAYQRLRVSLLGELSVDRNAEGLAATAGLTARLKELSSVSIARRMGEWIAGKGGPRLSELRFKRLLAAQDRKEWYPLMRRALALLDDTADLLSLAQAAWWWNDNTRQRWANDYYRSSLKPEIQQGETQ